MNKTDKKISVTYLRANLYKLLDKLIETGQSIEILRKGHKIIINMETETNVFAKLPKQVLTPSGMTESDLIYHGMGKFEVDPMLYNHDDSNPSIAAEPDND